MAAKKVDISEEIEQYRKDSILYNEFKGRLDAGYVSEFSKGLLSLGFTHDNIVTLLINKMTIDLSLDLKELEMELEKYKMGNGEPCNCPECKRARGEDDDGL